MREFFRGWRRKAGVVLLVMACASLTVWLRSQIATDEVRIERRGTRDVFHSFDGRIYWCRVTLRPGTVPPNVFPPLVAWKTYDLSHSPNSRLVGPFDERPNTYNWGWCGFYFGSEYYVNGKDAIWAVPYWSLLVPLTLLSAYLVLWKPRKRA